MVRTLIGTNQWRCAGASVIGVQHERNGGKCEDAWSCYRISTSIPEVLAVCVCDGAGSAPRGWEGANAISRLAAEWLAANFDWAFAAADETLKAAVFSSIKDGLHVLASDSGTALEDYACTMVALTLASDGRWFVLHLGDGSVIGQLGDEIKVISPPMKGEFVNETYFVTDGDAVANTAVVRSSDPLNDAPPRGFAIFTDGIESSLLNRHNYQVAMPVIRQMFGWLRENPEPQVTEALQINLKEVFRSKSGDDCTLVLVVEGVADSSSESDHGEGQKPSGDRPEDVESQAPNVKTHPFYAQESDESTII